MSICGYDIDKIGSDDEHEDGDEEQHESDRPMIRQRRAASLTSIMRFESLPSSLLLAQLVFRFCLPCWKNLHELQ